ncbi:MAG: hypothetical protein G01um101416_1007 [Microgenomates group bacterium Gr01-1014_16]|nr:MAG: hypothetical protein G01um101416_1007 [Microgenomates group bacterium Gr01-1014_16]
MVVVGGGEDFDGICVVAEDKEGTVFAVDAEAVNALVFGFHQLNV